MLALAATVLLLADPFLVHSVGFLLSCAASVGIAVLGPPIARRLPGPRWFRESLGVDLGAQVGVSPVLIPVFDGVPLVALPANLARRAARRAAHDLRAGRRASSAVWSARTASRGATATVVARAARVGGAVDRGASAPRSRSTIDAGVLALVRPRRAVVARIARTPVGQHGAVLPSETGGAVTGRPRWRYRLGDACTTSRAARS